MSIRKLNHLKQSIWVDHLSRAYLENGGLETHIKKGVSGVTSNPSILCQAILDSNAYVGRFKISLREVKILSIFMMS